MTMCIKEKIERLREKSLEDIVREGAELMLKLALDDEIEEFIKRNSKQELQDGRRRVVRNGFHEEREIVTTAGCVSVKVPRARDRGEGDIRFQSVIVPPYLKRADNIDEFVPFLYLKGISTGDFEAVLSNLLGKAISFSPNTVVRLKDKWKEEYDQWCNRDLSDKGYIYWWVDGVHFNVRLEKDRTCILVVMGARRDGTKELVAVQDGFRESEISWKELMLNLKRRGLKRGPRLAIGDGALGFWAALRKVFPKTCEQRCWIHKMANVLDKLPKRIQDQAKRMIKEIYMADTREHAEEVFQDFVKLYESKYPKAVQCLLKDKEQTLAFYDFPAEHWRHIRSTNPIESTFATVRLRTYKTKGCGTREATLIMVFKLVQSAQKRWQRLHHYRLIPFVLREVDFKDGEPQEEIEEYEIVKERAA